MTATASASADTSTAAPARRGSKPRVRRSLLDLHEARGDDAAQLDLPIEHTEARTPSLSLGIVTDEMEYIFPYIALQLSIRMGEQYSIAVGEYELTMLIANDLANQHGWESPAQDISRGLHGQTITWIHHRPDWGLRVEVTKREKEEGGGGDESG